MKEKLIAINLSKRQIEEKRLPLPDELNEVSTKAEAGLYSEAVVIEEQARQAQPLKDGENLLPVASSTAASEKKTKEPKP